MENMTGRLTKAQAVAAYKAIVASLGVEGNEGVYEQGGGTWPIGPVLVRGFEDRYEWAVVWEGGDYDWTFLAIHGGVGEYGHRWTAAKLPEGVWTEAVNSWSVALYAA